MRSLAFRSKRLATQLCPRLHGCDRLSLLAAGPCRFYSDSSNPLDVAALAQKLRDLEARVQQLSTSSTNVGTASTAPSPDADTSSAEGSDKKASDSMMHLLRSVVKVYCNVSVPNHLIPWQRKLQVSVTGSGFVVDRAQRLIMTNAHVVCGAAFVELRKHGDSAKYTGFVVYIGSECDLALVHVPEAAFWETNERFPELPFQGAESISTISPSGDVSATPQVKSGLRGLLEFGVLSGLPALQEKVQVIGYPVGGDQISITSGVVSRVDQSIYGGWDVRMLTIQLDAAINSGNSGGPAVSGSHVVGVAFQALVQGDNIGYIIPNPIISMFAQCFYKNVAQKLNYLDGEGAGIKDGIVAPQLLREYHPGFPVLGVRTMEATNVFLRQSLGLPPGHDGVVVNKVLPLSTADGHLLAGDVLLKINGYTIATDLTIAFRPNERILFTHLVNMTPPGETIHLNIWRDGKPLELDVPVKLFTRLVPNHLYSTHYNEKPKYEIFGGFVFTTLTLPLLQEWGNDWFTLSPRNLCALFLSEDATSAQREVVIVVQVLPHVVNKGYDSPVFSYRVVESINGTPVGSFEELQAALKNLPEDGLATISTATGLGGGHSGHSKVVLSVKAAREADKHLHVLYNIPSGNTTGDEEQ